jgi:hypothetical protein
LMLSFWVKNHGDVNFKGTMIHWDFTRAVFV